MKKQITLICTLILPLFLWSQSVAERASAYLQAAYEAGLFSGSAHVARGDEALFIGAVGHASIEFDIPNTPETKFRFGSITKQFTAVAVLQLVDQGKVDLEGVITDYLPDFPAKPYGARVTVHQLLNHTSGIPSYTGIEEIMSMRGAWKETPAEFVRHFEQLELEFEPGSQWSYNNSAYHLLGLIIEAVSGQSYEDYLQQHILQPVGMENTGVEQYHEVVPLLCKGYASIGEAPLAAGNINMDIPYAAGSMYGTVGDLHRWHQALTARNLLSEDSYKKMWTPYLENYGYGWGMREWFGRQMIGHSGGIDGFSTYTARLPEDNLYVSVLSNLEGANSGQIARDLAAIVLGEEYEMPQKRVAVEVDPALYDRYTGTYKLFPEFDIVVTREGDRLFAQATNQPKVELFPMSETMFFAKEIPNAKLEFAMEGGETAAALILHQGGQQRGERVQ